MLATLKIKEGASVLGAELTETVAVSSLESDVYVSFIIPIAQSRMFLSSLFSTARYQLLHTNAAEIRCTSPRNDRIFLSTWGTFLFSCGNMLVSKQFSTFLSFTDKVVKPTCASCVNVQVTTEVSYRVTAWHVDIPVKLVDHEKGAGFHTVPQMLSLFWC